jgi:RNA polymerase nonessential primary-like sigma factor
VARGIVAAHRARLDWLLRVPEWETLLENGMADLGLPGRRQGIPFSSALMALPLESKYALVRRTAELFRHHLNAAVGRKMCALAGLEAFNDLELDSVLTARQWTRLRDGLLFRLAQEHRRYKHAQQLLFMGYRHLVERVVAQIVFRAEHRADCAQEGALGLLHAIDRVDESGHDLGAYAACWIRRHVRNFLMRQRLPVHVPVNLISKSSSLSRKGGDAAGGASKDDDPSMSARMQALLLECLRHPAVSLDEPIDAAGATVAETVADVASESPADAATRMDVCAAVGGLLHLLTEKQRDVLARRFGLGGRAANTLAEIAAGAGISPQQVSMRERRALRRLEDALEPIAMDLYGCV